MSWQPSPLLERLKPGINPDDFAALRKPTTHKPLFLIFSLLLLVFLLVMIPYAWFVIPHLRASKQFKSLGAKVEWYVDRSNWMSGGRSDLSLEEHYGFIAWSEIGDNEMSLVGSLLNVEEVNFNKPARITDVGLRRIVELPNLRRLEIVATNLPMEAAGLFQITNAGLALLPRAKKLRHLTLQGADISDAGLIHIGAITTLDSLDLSETPITDAGLEHLKTLSNLEVLLLDQTYVSRKAAMAFQKVMPKIRMIEVSGPNAPSTSFLR